MSATVPAVVEQWSDCANALITATESVILVSTYGIGICDFDSILLQDSFGYEVLVGPPESIRWHPCARRFSLSQLQGSIPIMCVNFSICNSHTSCLRVWDAVQGMIITTHHCSSASPR